MKAHYLLPFLFAGVLVACDNKADSESDSEKEKSNIKEQVKEPSIVTEDVEYMADSVKSIGYIAYDENIEGARPVVMVVPEWWGLNDYAKRRARELAELGYVAMAVDMYGNRENADNPKLATELAMPFYQDPDMAKAHFDAALEAVKTYDVADKDKIAAVGYCFGGGMLLNVVRLGSDLDGIVSFHGSLVGADVRDENIDTEVLVLHGNDDQFVNADAVKAFKQQFDSAGVAYKFIGYDGATHAFTNPDATATGEKYEIPIAYNAEADTASWKEMKGFLEGVFK